MTEHVIIKCKKNQEKNKRRKTKLGYQIRVLDPRGTLGTNFQGLIKN